MLVEGFDDKALRTYLRAAGRQVEKDWRSIKLLEECLGLGIGEEAAKAALKSFREAHECRTITKGHFVRGKKRSLVKQALKTHGSFRAHFVDLAARCDMTLGLIMKTMGTGKEQ